jgi:acyl-coenzyme A thioesterase PaaI-like protein
MNLPMQLYKKCHELAQDFYRQEWEKGRQRLAEAQVYVRHPRMLSYLVRENTPIIGPWLGRQILGAASILSEPFTLGMGMRLENIGEDSAEVSLPGSWRNRGDGGLIHGAALSALGEHAGRLYWEYHLDLHNSEIEAKAVQLRLVGRAEGVVRAVFHLPVADREAILHQLRADNKASVDSQILIYDQERRLVAEVEIEWLLQRRLELNASPSENAKGEI